jgi:hypothetical protein
VLDFWSLCGRWNLRDSQALVLLAQELSPAPTTASCFASLCFFPSFPKLSSKTTSSSSISSSSSSSSSSSLPASDSKVLSFGSPQQGSF